LTRVPVDPSGSISPAEQMVAFIAYNIDRQIMTREEQENFIVFTSITLDKNSTKNYFLTIKYF